MATLADVVWNPLMEAKRVWKREEEVCQCDRNTYLLSKCAKCIQQEEEGRTQEQADKEAEDRGAPGREGDVETAEEQQAPPLEGGPPFSWGMAALSRLRPQGRRRRSGLTGSGPSKPVESWGRQSVGWPWGQR